MEENHQIEEEERVLDLWRNVSTEYAAFNRRKLELLHKVPAPIFQEQVELQGRIQNYITLSQRKQLDQADDNYFQSRYQSSILNKLENTEELLKKIDSEHRISLYCSQQDKNVYDPAKVVQSDQEYYEKAVLRGLSQQVPKTTYSLLNDQKLQPRLNNKP